MAGIARTFDTLKEAIIKEQVMKTYRRELVIILAEREYESLEHLGQVADRFEEAHSWVGATERKDRTHTGERSRTNAWQGNHNGKIGTNKHNPPDAKKTTCGDISDVPPRKIVC